METILFTLVIHEELLPDGDLMPLLDKLSEAGIETELQELGGIISQQEQEGFASQGGVFDDEWPELAESTLAEKRCKGYPETIGVRSGAMEAAIGQTIAIDGNSVMAGLDLSKFDEPYPLWFHGGTERGQPARVIAAVTPDLVDRLEEALNAWLGELADSLAGAVTIMAHYEG